jgi:hypothetical protein
MSIEDKARQAFQNYVNAASDLAEAVKDNIQHEGIVTDETVLKLNAFIIASNEIADLPLHETDGNNDNETDDNLN